MTTRLPLVLASRSPRRQSFLSDLGYQFDVVVADIDEVPRRGERPIGLAQRLSASKARAVAERLGGGQARLIVAADTVVAKGARVLGKPANVAEAMSMLVELRGGPHQVHSGLSVLDTASGRQQTRINSTIVMMRHYTLEEIRAYIATGDPFDKAGGYAIQHPDFAPAAGIDGCLSGVMGLPLADLVAILLDFGITPVRSVATVCEQYGGFSCCWGRRTVLQAEPD